MSLISSVSERCGWQRVSFMPSSELYSAGLGGERIPAGSCAFPFFPPRIPVLMESPAQAPLREAERAASAPAGDAKGQSGKESRRIAPFPAPVQPAAALSLPASLRGPLAARLSPQPFRRHPASCPSARGARTAAPRAGRTAVPQEQRYRRYLRRWSGGERRGAAARAHHCVASPRPVRPLRGVRHVVPLREVRARLRAAGLEGSGVRSPCL